MERYVFNCDKLSDLIDNLYPTRGLIESIDFNILTEENCKILVDSILDIINNPEKEIIDDLDLNINKISIFDEETNNKLNKIFSNKDLMFFGHGGDAKTIINNEFHCHYLTLDSHFLRLNISDEGLSIFYHWPHKDAHQVAIMALNIHEFTPIFKINNNPYSSDKYVIDNSYFVGYYDRDLAKFIENPNFKSEHGYDPDAKYFEMDQLEMGITSPEGPEEVKEFFVSIRKIARILLFANKKKILNDHGLVNLQKYILDSLKTIIELQSKFTPQLFEEYNEILKNENEEEIEDDLTDDEKPYVLGGLDDDWD